jgi:glycosyltransferase involved in cell wall biosynthesis
VLVSVVIPTYNRAVKVAEAIESVLAQDFGDYEIIVVDDGSTDDTGARLAARGEPRLRYVRQPNRKTAAARNAGVAVARGALVSFLDSDDLWKPDKLGREVDFLARRPDVGAVFSDLEKHDGTEFTPSFMRATAEFSKRLAGRRHPDGLVLPPREMFRYLLQEAPVMPTAFTVRRDVFAASGGFTTGYEPFEDWEFFLRLSRTTAFGYLDRPLAVLRISPDSIHRVYGETGKLVMLGVLARERRRAGGDAEIRAAARSGIVRLRTRLGWHYHDSGRRLAAFACYVRGFAETGDPVLLARASALCLPAAVRDALRACRPSRSAAEPTA